MSDPITTPAEAIEAALVESDRILRDELPGGSRYFAILAVQDEIRALRFRIAPAAPPTDPTADEERTRLGDLLQDLARKRLYYLMHVASEANTACGWASGIETELPPIARATAAGHRPPQDDDGNDEWWVGDAEAVEMVRLADLLGLGNEWWVNEYEPAPAPHPLLDLPRDPPDPGSRAELVERIDTYIRWCERSLTDESPEPEGEVELLSDLRAYLAGPIVRDELGTIHSRDKCGVIEGWMLQIARAVGLDTTQGITGSQVLDAVEAIRAAERAKEKA